MLFYTFIFAFFSKKLYNMSSLKKYSTKIYIFDKITDIFSKLNLIKLQINYYLISLNNIIIKKQRNNIYFLILNHFY